MIKNIQDKFNEVIRYSQNIENPQTDRLFEQWYENKKHFIDRWGGLTVEMPNVAVELDTEAKYQAMVEFGCLCRHKMENIDVDLFVCNQGRDAFFANKVENEYITKGGKRINKGMKISKALKFFTEDKTLLDEMQTKMSRIIQEAKFTGTMVMSVHPLDFLSISENSHNWRSCHALDGEYRCGNLSYMLDPHTFVCYVKSDKESEIPNFPFAWNSKKWRVLMYARKDLKMFMAGKQYPFENKELLDILFDNLISNAHQDDWSKEWLKPPLMYVERMIEDALGSMQFNDCLFSSSYRPVVRYSMDLQEEIHEEFLNVENKMIVGEAVECLCCGSAMVSLSETMLCDQCGDYGYCDCCGEAINHEDVYDLGGDHLCETCFENLASYCDRCDKLYDTRVDEMCWDEINQEHYCHECMDEIEEERDFERQDEEAWQGLL